MKLITVRVTPNGSRTEILGWDKGQHGEDILRIRLKAPPVDGKANAALVAFFCDLLDVNKSQVRLVQGEKSRMKVLEIPDDKEGRLPPK